MPLNFTIRPRALFEERINYKRLKMTSQVSNRRPSPTARSIILKKIWSQIELEQLPLNLLGHGNIAQSNAPDWSASDSDLRIEIGSQ